MSAVRYEDDAGKPETLAADLVVDASGRAAPTQAFLERIGSPKPDVTEIGIDIGYATAIFEIPADAPTEWTARCTFRRLLRRAAALSFSRSKAAGGSSRWREARRAPPGDLDGFVAFAKTFRTPTIYDAIRNAKPLTEIARYNLPASVRRHFDRLDRFPRGMIPLGDSVRRFNPVFGQGMSVAAMEAAVLGRQIASRKAAPIRSTGWPKTTSPKSRTVSKRPGPPR